MKLEQSTVVRLRLTELERLDPVTVFLEDFEPRKGKITIECYGKSWSSYWGGMGDSTIAEFFVGCNDSYLAKNLSSIDSSLSDYDAFWLKVKSEICSKRRYGTFEEDEARELFDAIENAQCELCDDATGLGWCQQNADKLHEILGDDWWFDIPTKPNPDYQYLCRIIQAVREGLKEYLKSKETTLVEG